MTVRKKDMKQNCKTAEKMYKNVKFSFFYKNFISILI